MTSHILQELQEYRAKLTKLASDAKNSEEVILDVLNVIEKVHMTPDLINGSGLGSTVLNIRKKFEPNTTVYNVSQSLLKSWKSLVDESKKAPSAPSTTAAPTAAEPSSSTSQQTSSKEVKESDADAAPVLKLSLNLDSNTRKSQLPPDRLSVFKIIQNVFTSTCNAEKADKIALAIEKELYASQHGELSTKNYTAKARSLAFNLKKNEVLHKLVESEEVHATSLVKMTPAELASQEVKVARNKILEEDNESRRLDWLEEHKQELQKGLGIDPNNNWEFQHDKEDDVSEPDMEAPDI